MLKTLKNSARNDMTFDSVTRKFLNTEKSASATEGVRKTLRPKFPYENEGTAKAAGLNHCLAVGCEGCGFPTKLGRAEFHQGTEFPMLATSPETAKLYGCPERNWTNPFICQLPRRRLAIACLFKDFLPFPNGSSQIPLI